MSLPVAVGQRRFFKTRPGDLVMPDHLDDFLVKNLVYFIPFKNQVESGYKGNRVEFMVNF